MLPTTASKGRGTARSAPPLFGPYLRRIVKKQRISGLGMILPLLYGESASHAALTITSVVFVHFLFAGIVLATLCWLYAFDVHCNSFFPAFVILYVLQYFLSPLLVAHGFFPALLSNLLFVVAISYYHYLNFLGYDVLPFLDRTTFFLYPIGLVIILSPLMILIGFNPTRYFLSLYFR
uniref:Uncharacterized protein n=1 Tax=Leersia perrieri TaxID=77586 RepID=A0A0D9XBD8_9ORYZ